jgi:hypothetical protein
MLRKLAPKTWHSGSAPGWVIYQKPVVKTAAGGLELFLNFARKSAVDTSAHGRDGKWEGHTQYSSFTIPGASYTQQHITTHFPVVIKDAKRLGFTDHDFTAMAWVMRDNKADGSDHTIFGTDETSGGKGLHLIVRAHRYYMGFCEYSHLPCCD